VSQARWRVLHVAVGSVQLAETLVNAPFPPLAA
jgi:hypothetical protein